MNQDAEFDSFVSQLREVFFALRGISEAMLADLRTASAEMLTPASPPRASPLSLSKIRLYLGRSFFMCHFAVNGAQRFISPGEEGQMKGGPRVACSVFRDLGTTSRNTQRFSNNLSRNP